MRKPFTRLARLGLSLWLFISCNLLLLGNYRLKASPVPEDQLKAAYLIHLSEFTTWPPEKMQDASFVICLSSGSTLTQPLEEIKNRPVKEKPLELLYDALPEKLNRCHVMYVENGNEKSFLQTLANTDAILTVSSKPDFAKAGGIIEYYRPAGDDRIRMRVNLKMLSQKKLTISSKLLRLMESDF